MTKPVVYGADYSVYVRIVRLALAEKGVAYDLEEVDIFQDGGPPESYRRRHPFARIPAFEHDGFRLYETTAITRYIDEAFPGPALMPDTVRARARVNQIIAILDSYAYRCWVWDIYVEREKGAEADEKRIAAALPPAKVCLSAIENLMDGDVYFIGDGATLADLHAAPMIAYLACAPEGKVLLDGSPRWRLWWDRMSSATAAL